MKTFAKIQKEIISHLKSCARSAQGLLYSIGLVVTLLLVGTGNVWGTDLCNFTTFNGWPTSAYADNKTYTPSTGVTWTFTGIYRQNTSQAYHQIKKNTSNCVITTPTFASDIGTITITFSAGAGTVTIKNSAGTSTLGSDSYTSSSAAVIDISSSKVKQVKICVSENNTATAKMTALQITAASGSTKTYHYWDGSSLFSTSSGGATLTTVPSLCDDAIEPYGWCSEETYASRDYPTSKIWFEGDSWPAGKTDLYACYRTGANPNYYYSTKPNVYTITYNLTNASKDASYSYDCTSDMIGMPSGSSVTNGNMWAYFKPAAGYTLDESSISITMGGSPVSSSNYSWDPEYSYAGYDYTAELYMENITGNVVVTVTGKTCTPLTAPTGLTLSTDHQGTAGKTRFGWNSVSGATGYKVTVTKGGVSASVTTASDRYYYITTFPDGDYTWTVQALGDGSTYCAEGTAANGTPFSYCHKDVSGVTPTVNAATSITATGATANWTAVSDADHYTVKVYEGTNASGTLRKTYSDVTGTSQAITGLTAGAATTYYIEVQAHDACGHNSSKAGVTFTTLAAHYTITYNKDAYSSGDQIAAGDKTHGVSFTLSSSTYSRDGYTQDGWSTIDGGSKAYELGGTYSGNADLNLYPHWHEITYTNYRTTCEAPKTLDHIAITTNPTKLNYLVGETVDVTGAVVTAYYTDETNSVVTPSVTWTAPSGALSAGLNQNLTASYTLGGVTKTATNAVINVYAVTLLKKDETGATISGELSDAPAVLLTSVNHLTAAETGAKYTFKEWQVTGGSLSSTSSLTPTIDAVSGAITVTAVYYKPITVTWHVPSGNFSGPSEYARGWATQFPSPNPDPEDYGCDGKVFYGWTRTANYDNASTPPTLVASGEVLTSDEHFYAVFAVQTSAGTPPTWTKTDLSSVTAGTYALLTTDYHAFNGTISGGRGQITSGTFSFTANESHEAPVGTCEVVFATSGSGFSMYVDGSGYLYASAASEGHLAYHNSESNYWSYYGSNWSYSANYSGKYAVLRSYDNSTFRTYGQNNGNLLVLAKKTSNGTPATYSDFATSCTCKGFSFHTGSGTDEAVKTTNTRTCFEQVDASTTWKIDDYVIPSDAKFFVGWQDEFKSSGLGSSSRSAVTQFNADEALYFEYTKNYGDGYRPSVGNAVGAIGTLRIWSDNSWNNCHVGFDPNGYIFKLGSTYYTMSNSATLDGARYKETEIITLTSTDISGKYQVNIAAVAPNASTGVASRYTENKNLAGMGVKSGASTWRGEGIKASDANTKGFFRIDKGEGGATNWNAHWVPCYELTFDLKGGTGTIVTAPEYVSVEAASKVVQIPTTAPTKDGYRFMGWSDTDGGGVNYAAGSTHNVTLSGNKTVYAVWAQEYTVTYAYGTGGTGSCTGGTYIQGETVTTCNTTPSKACSTFLGWTVDNGIGEKDAGATFAMPGANTTITARWNTTTYALTYKDQGDVTYSGSNAGSLPAVHTCGETTVLPDGERAGYRFDGWFTTSACTGDPITSIAGDGISEPTTLYAKWTASLTFTFKDYSNATVATIGQVEGGNVIMPSATADCGLWTTFEGWVESTVAETTTEPATIYRAGDIFIAGNTNKEFKALYSKHEGDGTVSYVQVTSNTVTPSGEYVIASPNGNTILTGLNGNKRGTYEAVTISDNTISNKGNGVVLNLHKRGNKFNIKMSGDTKYITTTSDTYFEYSVTDAADACMWELTNDGYIHSTDHTTRYIEFLKSGTQYFGAYTGTQWKAYLYRKKVAGTTYYATNPASCAVPTQITVSYNDNKSHAGDQTITGMPSGTTLTFTDYPDFASYTVGSAPTDPTGYHFTGWNTSGDGNGDDYTAGSSVTTFGYTESVTLFAQWERVYSVTLYDNGVERTTLVEASAGAGVTLPNGNNCTPSSTFTFEGWTESAVELNADPVRPATLHAAGAFAPTSDITLYSVYSKSVAGCEDFAAGVSGAYTVQRDSYYAQNTGSDNQFDIATTNANAAVFYIAYSQAKSGYTIRTKDGYIGWNYDGSNITRTATSPYYWNINGSAVNGWKFTPQGVSSKYLSLSTSGKFKMYGTDYGYNTLTKTAMKYYYNTAICEGAQITFHDGGGTISGTPTTPTGASWNSSTHVLSGLEDCDKITEFPTANYDGWTFIGWSTEDYSNSGKHTTDHPEENAGTDEPDGSEIYKTGGNSYVVRGGSIDLYPIFTRFPENEPFNEETGGRYYIYYLKPGTDDGYGSQIRVYAGERDNDVRYKTTKNCASAVEFNFVKDGDIWHIIDTKNGNKYVAGVSGNDNLNLVDDLSGSCDDWTITIKSGNQFYASCQSGGRYISFSTSANSFMDYSTTANPGICLPVYLGTCTERIFSSEPEPTPTIDLEGEPYVTSSNGERVRATATMTLSAAHLNSLPANKVIISGGSNLKFATTASANPDATVSLSLTDGNLAATTIYVYYTPSATEDGLENIIVTAKAYNGSSYKEFQKTGTVHARHLPADFVIAAKWNDKWYALPNTCTSSGSSTTGVLISVDNESDPTCATYAPTTAKWGMRETKKGSRSDGSYNDRLVFTERGTTATANSQQALYNYNSADIFTNATYTNYNNENPDRYEWIPVTSDFKDYTLTNANNASRTLILRNSDGEFKAQDTDQAYEGKVRLLPATFLDANVQIIEWKASSVVIMYTGTETTAKTKVGTNSASGSQTLSSKKIAHGIYELSASPSLTGNAGKNLEISFGSDVSKKLFEIPVIITGNSTAATGHDKQDVVIVKGAKLTAAGTKYSYRNIYVYGGGKLKIASGTSLGVNNIILRAGNISTDGSGGSATYEYIYPQVELGGTLTSTKTDIKYEYITDYTHWYQLCLPFNASLNSIHYPQEYYGDNVAADNHGSWVIKRYAGEIRATGEYDAWKDIETEGATSVTAGHGYLYWGAPKKVTIGEDKQRQAWGIQRITMPVTAAAATSAETDDKNITVDSYSEVATSTKPNDQGWNLVGNPYMVNLTDFSSTSMVAGKLVQEKDDKENWTGKWKNDGTNVRYVTVPDNHFDNYEAKTASVAAADGDFMPGRAFFVQIAEGATTLTFAAENRASLMPALFARATETVDIETGIVMSDETKKDEVNFWIKDGKTAEYEYNADYPKTPNSSNFNIYGVHDHGDLSWIAISPKIAEGSMAIGYQVPAAGDYMLSLSETYVSDDIEHIFVTDHEASPEVTVDLVERDYMFHVNQAETNNTRFTVSIKLKDEDTGTTTDIDHLKVDSDVPTKFIYQDKMYILYQGVIYDATGKKVREINK